jgi:DNA polymerase-2
MSLNKEEMDEVTGWLFDVYDHPEGGIVLWVITDASERLRLRMDFPITFYAGGDFKLLRAAWIFLKGKAQLARVKRRDLFLGERDVMQVTLTDNGDLIHELQTQFPALDYYDADIPITLRFIARTGVHLLGRCRITLDRELIQTIQPLDSPWQLSPEPIPLRMMEIIPNVDPASRSPTKLALSFVEGSRVRHERGEYSMSVDPLRPFLIGLQADLLRFDPDLILTDHGDAWLFLKLTEWCKETGLHLDINRDTEREIQTKKAGSYFAYGQTIHRGAQSHLFGRWHIDRRNAMLFSEYGLDGVLEQTRVTGIGVQEMARKSPGAGITAMQMVTALRTGVMIPLHKQQAEGSKTLAGLIRADKGGLIYQPIIGVHRDVAQIDFASMYPSIMVHHNISPETIGQENAEQGLIPQTLQPLLEKRLKLKELISGMDERDCRVKSMKQRAAALKWLLVVCFGYLGYKNARFGKIESHEMVTAISRELMLQAKEVAEDMGFTVLHMYVDSLFVQKEGVKEKRDFEPLLHAITEQTHIPIMMEGIYRWVCFPPSKRDARIYVPNRYFGALNNGEIKYRGIEARRRDTPFWVKKIQLEVLNCLAKAGSLDEVPEYLPEINNMLTQAKRDLRDGHVPLEELVVIQSLSKAVEGYTSPSPAARAAMQLQAASREVAPGQFMRFVFVRGEERVRAWELGVDTRMVDVKRYSALLNRTAETVLSPFEKEISVLQLL